jgi:hypothetical protein
MALNAEAELNSIRSEISHATSIVNNVARRLDRLEQRQQHGSWVQIKLDDRGVVYAYNLPRRNEPLQKGDLVVVRLPNDHLVVRPVAASGKGSHHRATKNAALFAKAHEVEMVALAHSL